LRRVVAVLVGCVAIAALGGGCGGSSSGDSPAGSESELTRAEWAHRADAICSVDHEENAKRESEFEALLRQGLTSPRRRDEAADLIRAAVPGVERETKAIAALFPPSAEATTTGTVVAELEATAKVDQRLAEALERGGAAELETIFKQAARNAAALEALAQELDLQVCGRPEEAE